MRALKPVAIVVSLFLFSGCASGYVQRGMLWGALVGAAIGGGTGVLISDESLLGSSTSNESGDVALSPGDAIPAGLVIGAVTGAVVGAMVGHRRDEGYARPVKESEPDAEEPSAPAAPEPAAPDAEPTPESASALHGMQEWAPYVRGL